MTRELSVRTIHVSLTAAVVVTVLWAGMVAGTVTCVLLAVTR